MADDLDMIEMLDDEGNPIAPPPPDLVQSAVEQAIAVNSGEVSDPVAGNPDAPYFGPEDDPSLGGEVITGNPIDSRDEVQDEFYAGSGEYAPERWDSIIEDGANGAYIAPGEAPAPAPLSAPPVVSAAGSTSTSRGRSISVAQSGVPEQKQKSFYDDYLAQTEQSKANAAAGFSGDMNVLNNARILEAKAAIEMGVEQTEHLRRMMEFAKEERDFEIENLRIQERNMLEAEAARARYMTEYESQLGAMRALMAQNPNPLASLSTAQGAGMGAAMFAQGFLAARGIQINVGAQIDKWVDREIAVHQQKINNAGDALDGTQTMYQMVRQNSQDEWEARQRYRGLFAEAMKAQVQVEAMRFGSAVANAKAMQRVAEIERESLKTKNDLAKYYHDRMYKELEEYRNQWAERGKQANESRRIAIAQQEANTNSGQLALDREKHKDDKASKVKEGVVIYDTEYVDAVGQDGKPVIGPDGKVVQVPKQGWRIRNNAESVKGAEAARVAWAVYDDAWNKVMEARERAYRELEDMGLLSGVISGNALGAAERASPAFREYKALKSVFIREQLRHDSGQTVTDQEATEKEKQYPDEVVFAAGANGDVFISMREVQRQKFERKMETYSIDVPRKTASPGAARDYGNAKTGAAPITGVVQKVTATAREGGDGNVDSTPPLAWRNFGRESMAKYEDREWSAETTPEWAGAFMKLGDMALNPEKYAEEGDDPAEIGRNAALKIQNASKDMTLPSDRRDFAKYLITLGTDDPERLRFEIENDGTGKKPDGTPTEIPRFK